MALAVFLTSFEWSLQAWMTAHRTGVGYVIYAALLTIPVSAAYLLGAEHVVEFGPAVRCLIPYLASQWTIAVVASAPFAVLAARLYLTRDDTLAHAVSASVSPALASGLIGGALLIRFRAALTERFGRWFLNERRDAFRSLNTILAASRDAAGVSELLEAVRVEIEGCLNCARAHVLALDSRTLTYVGSGRSSIRPLPQGSAIVAIAAATAFPVLLDLEAGGSVAALLPESDREWLMDADGRVVASWLAGEKQPALLVLGPKRSQLPYTVADRRFIKRLLTSVGSLFDSRSATSPGLAANPTPDEGAVECQRCGAVSGPASSCACGGALDPAPVPLLLAGKFLVERRIGRGGMGVVYSAWDQSLDRRVAIKTLPRTTTAAVVRLRREARAMAKVSHPNIAQILALETWRGIPVIVAEHLAGGTLADRLASGPPPTEWILDLGVVLAGTLDDLHRAGLLHRDVKPSNIGFAEDGTPKLLDFGVAEMLTNLSCAPAASAGSASDPLRSARFGTPGYLPPEASSGAAPTPAWDLWSLALVLYECVAGRNPLLGDGQPGTGGSVRRPEVPDVRRYSPLCPAPLAEFLGAALSTSPHRRPSSSVDFRNRLLGLLAVRPAA